MITKNLLFVLVGASAILTAFAPKMFHFTGTTYYAVTNNAGGYCWTKTKPVDLVCQAANLCCCTIVTIGGYTPICNVCPTVSQATCVHAPKWVYK
jgi:hypothetical protein